MAANIILTEFMGTGKSTVGRLSDTTDKPVDAVVKEIIQ